MSEWQPIETAPKDGTEILVGGFSEGGNSQLVLYYDEHPNHPTHPWHSSDGGDRYHRDFPTHWMPLPPPPVIHKSDCAVNNGPALPPGPCNCGAEQ